MFNAPGTGNGAFTNANSISIMNEEESKKWLEEFLKKTHAAVESGRKKLTPKELDGKINNHIASWWKNDKQGYLAFKARGKSDVEFFAHNQARAGVSKEDGWEFTKKTLSGFYGFSEELKAKYDVEYDRTPFEQECRDSHEQH